MKARCLSCGAEIEATGVYHAGFSQVGFVYCDRDSTVLTFGVYDTKFNSLVGGHVAPWNLSTEDKKKVEEHLIACPCGGRFSFGNHLVCPVCKGIFAKPIDLRNIYYVVLDREIDGEKTNVWKGG